MQKGERTCDCCGEPAGQTRAVHFPFCGACWETWKASKERLRAREYGGGPATLTAIEDFIRRLRAEKLNGG